MVVEDSTSNIIKIKKYYEILSHLLPDLHIICPLGNFIL